MNVREKMKIEHKTLIGQARIISMIASGLMLIAGVLLLIWQNIDGLALRYIVSACFIVAGAARIFGYFSNDLYKLAFQFDFALGIFFIVMCLWLIFSPDSAVARLQIMAGVFLLIDGLQKVQTAMEAKAFGMRRWWTILTGGSIAIVVSAFVLFPILPGVSPALLVGLALVVDALQNGWNTMYTTIRVRNRRITKAFDETENPVEDNKTKEV